MSAAASLFLRAKHWQLFLLPFMLFIGKIGFLASLETTAPSAGTFPRISLLYGIVIVLSILCILGWFWSLGSFLNAVVQPPLRLKTRLFRFAIGYTTLYVLALIAVFQSADPNVLEVAILPFGFLAIFCIFYLMYFVSKCLVLAQTGKPTSPLHYLGPFILIWLFPIGLWIIQPRVNRLYAGTQRGELLDGAKV